LIKKEFQNIRKEIKGQKNKLPNLAEFCDEKQDSIEDYFNAFKDLEKNLKVRVHILVI